jgi:hypothetical protein
MVAFKKATRVQKKLRCALIGPAGAGKTRTALRIAAGMGGKVALIDSEHGSANMFADLADFDAMELHSFAPDRYIEAIEAAEAGGYDVLIVDSLSHAWAGKDGILEYVDRTKKNGNSFNAWGDATPMQNRLIEKLLTCKLHLIVTLRSKMEYLQEKDERTGKTTIRKVGMQPVQRDGVEFEFDVICDIDQDHTLRVAKTRIDDVNGVIIEKAGEGFGKKLRAWLDTGAPAVEAAKSKAVPTPGPARGQAAKPTKPASPTGNVVGDLTATTATGEQKATMKASLVVLGITEGQGAYVRDINGGTRPETSEEFERVNLVLAQRVDAKQVREKLRDPEREDPPSPDLVGAKAQDDGRIADEPQTISREPGSDDLKDDAGAES